MAGPRLDQVYSVKMQPGLRQIVRMQQADLLQLTDIEFHNLIIKIERSPLFQRLYHQARLIRYQRFPGSDIYPRFHQLKEGMAADAGSLDIETLISSREDVVRLIEKLGVEKFNRFFLFPEGGITSEEIAGACNLDIQEVKAINSFVNSFAIMSEFYHPPVSGAPIVAYTKIASVEKYQESFVISYFSPAYARGRYSIDYGKFHQLSADDSYDTGEIKEIKKLFKQLELINNRKNTINNILQSLIKKQALYLESGNSLSLLPFSQKELARETSLAPSSVSRAIHGKSLITPWGEEVPLKNFLPAPKRFKKELIRQLLQTEPDLPSDEATRVRLREKLGVAISRRSIAELRRELKLPARGKSGKAGKTK